MSATVRPSILLSSLAGQRVGVDGTWLLAWMRSQLKRDDPYWCLAGPVSPAMEASIDKFTTHFARADVKLVFVFDGLYTAMQAHPPNALHNPPKDGNAGEYARHMAVLEADVAPHVMRLLLRRGYEVITAPFLAWAQLALLAYSPQESEPPYITEIIAAADVLCFGRVSRVITDVCDAQGELSAHLTMNSLAYDRHAAERVFEKVVWAHRATSVHWSWVVTELTRFSDTSESETRSEILWLIRHCPVWTSRSTLEPLCKALGDGIEPRHRLCDVFHGNLNVEAPLAYHLMQCNVLSPALLAVIAAGRFVDDAPLFGSDQFNGTMERIMPLRAQVVFQLMQALEDSIPWLRTVQLLRWTRWMSSEPPLEVPIHRPPKIVLDEWAGIDDTPTTFVSVLRYAENAKVAADGPVRTPEYATDNAAMSAVLLKTMDLLGYFTHAAHAGQDREESSKSIFAEALGDAGEFADEAVLLIELTRTQSLHDNDLTVHWPPSPPSMPARGRRFATRLMSLLPLKTTAQAESAERYLHPDLSAFNEIARVFQRNLRYLTEAIACAQILRGAAPYPGHLPRLATRLPFGKPLSTHAGRVLDHMLSREFAVVPREQRLAALAQRFPYLPNLHSDLGHMKRFFDAAMDLLHRLSADEEANPETRDILTLTCAEAQALVGPAFDGVLGRGRPF